MPWAKALTCHLVMPQGHPGSDFFTRVGVLGAARSVPHSPSHNPNRYRRSGLQARAGSRRVRQTRRRALSPYRAAVSWCLGMFQSFRGESAAPRPDGGEGFARRKGCRREARSEGSVEPERPESMDGAGTRPSIDKQQLPRSPYPVRMRSVNSATVHGRRLNLPRRSALCRFGD